MTWTPLHKICMLYNDSSSVPKKIIPFMNLVHDTSPLGSTPLHFACLGSNIKLVDYLLHNGSKIIPNNKGETPLHYAVQANSIPIIKYLLNKMSINEIQLYDHRGASALTWAVEDNNNTVIQLITSRLKYLHNNIH